MSKIREKESLECVRMHIWASKTQKLPGPLSGPWTLAEECSLRSRDSTSLCRQLSASEAGAPPWPNPGSAPEFNFCEIKADNLHNTVNGENDEQHHVMKGNINEFIVYCVSINCTISFFLTRCNFLYVVYFNHQHPTIKLDCWYLFVFVGNNMYDNSCDKKLSPNVLFPTRNLDENNRKKKRVTIVNLW